MVIKPEAYLEHYGVGGMRWGIRRYQNPDGSLTEEGRKRYGTPRKRAKLYTKSIRNYTNMQRSFEENNDIAFKSNEKLSAKLEKAKAEGNDKQVKSINKKIAKNNQKIVANSVMIGTARRNVEKILEDAMANNYKIKSKDVTRGKDIVNKLFNVSPTTLTEYKVKKTRYST